MSFYIYRIVVCLWSGMLRLNWDSIRGCTRGLCLGSCYVLLPLPGCWPNHRSCQLLPYDAGTAHGQCDQQGQVREWMSHRVGSMRSSLCLSVPVPSPPVTVIQEDVCIDTKDSWDFLVWQATPKTCKIHSCLSTGFSGNKERNKMGSWLDKDSVYSTKTQPCTSVNAQVQSMYKTCLLSWNWKYNATTERNIPIFKIKEEKVKYSNL